MPRETSVKNISRIGVSTSECIDRQQAHNLLAAKTYGSVFHFGGFRVKNYSDKPFWGPLRVNFRTCTACTPLWDN